MGTIERKASAPLARPLSTLAPLIRKEIEAGDEAGIEHYRRAGEMLLEAKEQCEHGEWMDWIERNFHLGRSQVARYMKLAKADYPRRGNFKSIKEAIGEKEKEYRSVPPAWQAPVQRIAQRVDVAALIADEQSHTKERKLIHDLAEQLIDIGYKVLASQLHPDKGGSPEAMARLNKVRQLLKESI